MLGEAIVGVDRQKFDDADAKDFLLATCACGVKFQSKRQDLAARFKRGNNVCCRKCVNTVNGTKGGFRTHKKEKDEKDKK